MSLSTNIGAYPECFEHWEKATAIITGGGKGYRLECTNAPAAKHLMARMNQARALLRRDSRRMYPKDDARWDKSEFDHLKLMLRDDTDGNWWIYIISHGSIVVTAEEITDEEHQQL